MNDISVIMKEFGELEEWRTAPDFWVSIPNKAMPFIESLKEATVKTIGTSAGGRNIIAVEYGEKEPLDATCDNLNSCLASKLVPPDPTQIFPDAFFGSKRRRRPVLVLQGAIHGGELTGTVASLNLCHIIETGTDLRGKEWPKLREMARDARICIIPWLNIDGSSRIPYETFSGMPSAASGRMSQGVAKDGTSYTYPACKRVFPIPPEDTAFMGTYYNDAGVNLQYDFTTVERQPETTAWMRYYLDEKPDGVLVWHCNAGSLIGPAEYYLPPGHQFEQTRLAGAVRGRLKREGYGHPIGRLSWAGLPGMGKPFVEQSTALYHVCGALPVMCELPNGAKEWTMSNDDMLDIGLIVIEEVLLYAHTDGLRPYETWEKVKKSL